jgi:hypothetical protein
VQCSIVTAVQCSRVTAVPLRGLRRSMHCTAPWPCPLTALETLIESVALGRNAFHPKTKFRVHHFLQICPLADIHTEGGHLQHLASHGGISSLQYSLQFLPVRSSSDVGIGIPPKCDVVQSLRCRGDFGWGEVGGTEVVNRQPVQLAGLSCTQQ